MRDLRQVATGSQQHMGDDEGSQDEDAYSINIFRIKSSAQSVKPKHTSQVHNKKDFKVQVIINNSLDTVVADTGARISVCGTTQAKKVESTA